MRYIWAIGYKINIEHKDQAHLKTQFCFGPQTDSS